MSPHWLSCWRRHFGRSRRMRRRSPRSRSPSLARANPPLRVVPLGGVGEIGKNMLALEVGYDILVIDAGLMFPDEEMLGIDLVIPDITYLKQNKSRVRAVILTHAHEDHMGGLPYFLRDFLEVPIYGTKLTLGLMRSKLREHKLAEQVD